MFERISILLKSQQDPTFDLGLLGEVMLFYREVIILFDFRTLESLVRKCGVDVLLKLMDRGYLNVKYLNQHIGLSHPDRKTRHPKYELLLMGPGKLGLEGWVDPIFSRVAGRTSEARRAACRFLELAEEVAYTDYVTGGQIAQEVREAVHALRGLDGQQDLPGHIMRYAEIVANLMLCSVFDSELAVDTTQAVTVQSRLENVIRKALSSEKERKVFFDFVFDDARAVREVINSGERTLEELLPILDEKAGFGDWLRKQRPDVNLTKAYYKEVTKKSWIDKLPNKIVRWAMFTGGGLAVDLAGGRGIGTTIGVGLSALDAFLLDRLIKGWRPHQFVEGPLRNFLKT